MRVNTTPENGRFSCLHRLSWAPSSSRKAENLHNSRQLCNFLASKRGCFWFFGGSLYSKRGSAWKKVNGFFSYGWCFFLRESSLWAPKYFNSLSVSRIVNYAHFAKKRPRNCLVEKFRVMRVVDCRFCKEKWQNRFQKSARGHTLTAGKNKGAFLACSHNCCTFAAFYQCLLW